MCRERRAVWKARLEIRRRLGHITDGHAQVGKALITRQGKDGRCDPSHETLAADSAESVSTVKRALSAFRECGLVWWAQRMVRDGWRAVQTSNAYVLTLGDAPSIPSKPCEVQIGRETRQGSLDPCLSSAPSVSDAEKAAAQAALARRRAAFAASQGAR
jgi:hypothetical protein